MTVASDDRARLREALIEQLAYLMEEVNALRVVITRVPEEILSGRPYPGEISVKEMYGVIALADEAVYLPRVVHQGLTQVVDDTLLAAREPWPEYEMEAILERVRLARQGLVDGIRGRDPADWESGGLYALLHEIIQHDTDMLRAAGHRLNESRLR